MDAFLNQQPLSATFTFLMTDVEGSTGLWNESPRLAAEAIREHEHVIEKSVRAHGGLLVRSKGEGDSTFSAFATPEAAIHAVAQVQAGLEALPLRIRTGIHTGTVEYRDNDFYGRAPNECARLRSLAKGGQVLVSEATWMLLGDLSEAGVELADLGRFRLRGLTETRRVFQLIRPGDEPASPGALQDRPNNLLPMEIQPIGRDQAIEFLTTSALDTGRATVHGSGGCGKSLVALAVAWKALYRVPDGVWWISAEELSSVEALCRAMLQATGERGAELESLVRAFADRQCLFVIDGADAGSRAIGLLSGALFQNCPGVKLLATARAPLGYAREAPYRLLSLSPEESLQLFLARAGQAAPEVIYGEHEAGEILELCALVDGIPLAVELLAAHSNTLSLGQMRERLDTVLSNTRDPIPKSSERQRTMVATLEWSFQLLSAEGKRLFTRLASLPADADLELIEAATTDELLPVHTVLPALRELIAHSLVEAKTDDDGTRTFSMGNLTRRFALARAVEPAKWNRRVQNALLEMAQSPSALRHARHIATALLESPTDAKFVDRVYAMRKIWSTAGLTSTGVDLTRLAIEVPYATVPASALHNALGALLLASGNHAEAKRELEQARRMQGDGTPDLDRATTSMNLAIASADEGSGDLLREAAARFGVAGAQTYRAIALINLGVNQLDRNDDGATATLRDAVEAARAASDLGLEAAALARVSWAQLRAGKPAESRKSLTAAMRLWLGSPNPGEVAAALVSTAGLIETDEVEGAAWCLAAALWLEEASGEPLHPPVRAYAELLSQRLSPPSPRPTPAPGPALRAALEFLGNA